jgi:hypothetical protein
MSASLHGLLGFPAPLQNYEKRLLGSSCLSVRPSSCPHRTSRLPLEGFSCNLIFECFSKICPENSTRITSTLPEDQYASLIIFRSVLRVKRNILDKSCRENQNTHFVSNNTFFENRAVNEKMWKNIAEPGRAQMILWHVHISWWTPKAANTQTECVTLIAVPLQRWLPESTCVTLHVQCLSCLLLERCILPQEFFAHPEHDLRNGGKTR